MPEAAAWVLLDDEGLRDRGLLLRRWGRRSELHFYGSKRRNRDFWEDLDGIHYDNQFIFDELAWNFEPSEIGAAFGLQQLNKVPQNFARRTRSFAQYTDFFSAHTDRFRLPRPTDGLDTAWLCFPLTIAPDAGFVRADLPDPSGRQRGGHPHGVDRQRHPPAVHGPGGLPPAQKRAAQRRCHHGAGGLCCP